MIIDNTDLSLCGDNCIPVLYSNFFQIKTFHPGGRLKTQKVNKAYDAQEKIHQSQKSPETYMITKALPTR